MLYKSWPSFVPTSGLIDSLRVISPRRSVHYTERFEMLLASWLPIKARGASRSAIYLVSVALMPRRLALTAAKSASRALDAGERV